MSINISEPVVFDGAAVVVGGVRLVVERCEVKDINFSFTPKYGLLLLNDEFRVEAQRFLKVVSELSLAERVRQDLVQQAFDKGFGAVAFMLDCYKAFVPTFEPKFYAAIHFDKQINTRVISLVSDEVALYFYVLEDMAGVISQLPLNVYQSCATYVGFSLSARMYQSVLGREKEFFAFVLELNCCRVYVRGDACEVCYMRYFEDPVGAYVLLGELQRRVSRRECRDQLFEVLEREGCLEFSLGLFVRYGWATFFVSNEGDVRRLCYRRGVEVREAVLKAYAKGKLPTKLEEVTDVFILRGIAEVVGKIRPELTLLILP